MNPFASHVTSPRAVVAVPPIEDFYFTGHRFTSLGARIVCNILSEHGLQVSYLNFPLSSQTRQCKGIPDKMDYLADFILPHETGRLSYFTQYQRFGPPYPECAKRIAALKPHYCFLSCFAFAYSMSTIALARQLKNLQPDLPISVGGAGPSAHPLLFINEPAIDFVFTGEAETSVKAFLDVIINHNLSFEQVPNLFWKESHRIKKSPVSQWTRNDDIAVIFSESRPRKNRISLTTSLTRGCSKQCSFCSQAITHGAGFRTASIDSVAQALEKLPRTSEFQDLSLAIHFEDDNILLDKHYFSHVLELLKDKYPYFSITMENGIDYSLLTPELVDQLIGAGMSQFNVSITTINETIVKNEKRYLDISLYQSIIRAIAKHSVPAITYIICGFKDDSKESITDTLAFLAAQPTIIGISMYYAVPGIENFTDARTFDNLPPYLCCGSSAYPWNKSISTQTLITAFRLSRYCNLVKQPARNDMENEIIRTIRTTQKLHTFIKSPTAIVIKPVENCDEELVRMFFKKAD